MAEKRFQPGWNEEPPRKGSYRSIFKLGRPDEFKHPRAELIEIIKYEFGMTDADFKKRQFEGHEVVTLDKKPGVSGAQIAAFQEMVGPENVSLDDYDRVKYSSGQTLREVFDLRHNRIADAVDLVVKPRNKHDVQNIVRYACEQKIPVSVYGGGSSVVQGIAPRHGGVVLVMNAHMNRILSINELNQTATVQPGMMGPEYEEALNQAPERFNTAHRYTGGHFPQSFEISSVGGWVVTLGSGQASTYYGDAYHLALAQEYVTPAGSFKTHVYPASAAGPKVNDIMKGSEGAFGILVEQTMKIFRFQPENRQYFSFMFPSWDAAVEASREIMQGEFGMPAVYRISDPEETDHGLKLFGAGGKRWFESLMAVTGKKPGERCIAMGTAEGEKGYTRHVKAQIKKISRRHGATYLSGFPARKWEKTRYKEPMMREDWMDYGIIADTLETSVTWDNLHRVHQEVRAFVKARPRTVCMTHASHFYMNGTNLYFIFMLKPDSWEEFAEFHAGVVSAIVQAGGSISHHHGVGRLLAPWLEAYLGPEQMAVLRALKKHFDPQNLMNPGGLLALDPPPSER